MTTIDFPINCSQCIKSLNEGDIFYQHPKLGIVCENCPEFSDGGVSVESPSNVVSLDDARIVSWFNILAMCILCKKRWIGTVASGTSLFKLECPQCGEFDSFASFLPGEYLEEFRE